MKKRQQAKRPPRERLIEAAIEQIEAHGLAKLTVRAVAATANANVASVNYYFRSKDALVAAALETSIQNMVSDCNAYVDAMADRPEEALSELLAYLFEGGLRFPQLSKAHLHAAFTDDDYTGVFPVRFTPVMRRLAKAIQSAVPGLHAEQAAHRAVVALSGVFFPAFFSGLYAPLNALSTTSRKRYVRTLAQQACAPR